MPFDRHVSHQRLFELHAAAIAHDMGPRQERLLEGLSPAFIATIPDDGLPVDRLLTTLHRLNVIERLEDGSVPLHVWLRNAFALTRDEAFAVGRAERGRTATGTAVNAPDDPKVQAIRAKYKERAALAEQGRTAADVIAEIVRLKRELYTTSDLGPKVLLSGSRYELLEPLGKGGVGAVWKAYDDVCRRHVAVKVLLPEHGQAVLARFRRGARCMSELEHPNVVRVVQSEGVEERDGVKRWFFVMEHLPGGTLKAAVLEKRMRPEEALRKVIEVGSGLSHAHAKGMIHRDVTPDNVVLAANGAAKLTDFDLVRAEDTTGLTKTGQAFGKVMYVAPELWNGSKDADTRADVYALGMMAMFATHGAELPPEAMAFRDTFIHGLNVEEGVRAVVRKAVAWRREDRYESVEALCCELNRALDPPVVTISRAADPDAETLPDPGPTPPSKMRPSTRWVANWERVLDPFTPEARRLRIGEALGRAGDPRLSEDARWIEVPEGPYWRGAVEGDTEAFISEKPGGIVQMSAFKIARWPVTVGEYSRFLMHGEGYHKREWWMAEGWAWRVDEGVFAPGEWPEQNRWPPNAPVTNVSWWEAMAYCAWRTSLANDLPRGWVIRLPTEAEWEKAARGPDPERRIFPWGDAWDAFKANAEERICKPTPVGCFPGGCGPYGAWDQAGNVWEWCLDWYAHDAYKRQEKKDPRLLKDADAYRVKAYDTIHGKWAEARYRCVRGGGWDSGVVGARISCRGKSDPRDQYDDLGFRCVMARLEDF